MEKKRGGGKKERIDRIDEVGDLVIREYALHSRTWNARFFDCVTTGKNLVVVVVVIVVAVVIVVVIIVVVIIPMDNVKLQL